MQLSYLAAGKAQVQNETVAVEDGKQKVVSFNVAITDEAATDEEGAGVMAPILVAELNQFIPGVLTGIVEPPEFYYAFEAGDLVVLDITMSNRKGTNSLEVLTYPGGVLKYKNMAFTQMNEQQFRIDDRGIYCFRLATNHAVDRNATIRVKRIPKNENTKDFNTNVIKRTVYEPLELVEKRTLVVNSRTNIGGSTRAVVPVNIPADCVEWYYRFSTSKLKADPQQMETTNSLLSELGTALMGGDPLLGTTMGLLASLSQPEGGEACDVYLLDQNNVQAFQNKAPFNYQPQGGGTGVNSGNIRVDCCLEGQWYLGFRNNALSDGIQVHVEAVAIIAEEVWEMEGQ